eukprot:403334333
MRGSIQNINDRYNTLPKIESQEELNQKTLENTIQQDNIEQFRDSIDEKVDVSLGLHKKTHSSGFADIQEQNVINLEENQTYQPKTHKNSSILVGNEQDNNFTTDFQPNHTFNSNTIKSKQKSQENQNQNTINREEIQKSLSQIQKDMHILSKTMKIQQNQGIQQIKKYTQNIKKSGVRVVLRKKISNGISQNVFDNPLDGIKMNLSNVTSRESSLVQKQYNSKRDQLINQLKMQPKQHQGLIDQGVNDDDFLSLNDIDGQSILAVSTAQISRQYSTVKKPYNHQRVLISNSIAQSLRTTPLRKRGEDKVQPQSSTRHVSRRVFSQMYNNNNKINPQKISSIQDQDVSNFSPIKIQNDEKEINSITEKQETFKNEKASYQSNRNNQQYNHTGVNSFSQLRQSQKFVQLKRSNYQSFDHTNNPQNPLVNSQHILNLNNMTTLTPAINQNYYLSNKDSLVHGSVIDLHEKQQKQQHQQKISTQRLGQNNMLDALLQQYQSVLTRKQQNIEQTNQLQQNESQVVIQETDQDLQQLNTTQSFSNKRRELKSSNSPNRKYFFQNRNLSESRANNSKLVLNTTFLNQNFDKSSYPANPKQNQKNLSYVKNYGQNFFLRDKLMTATQSIKQSTLNVRIDGGINSTLSNFKHQINSYNQSTTNQITLSGTPNINSSNLDKQDYLNHTGLQTQKYLIQVRKSPSKNTSFNGISNLASRVKSRENSTSIKSLMKHYRGENAQNNKNSIKNNAASTFQELNRGSNSYIQQNYNIENEFNNNNNTKSISLIIEESQATT